MKKLMKGWLLAILFLFPLLGCPTASATNAVWLNQSGSGTQDGLSAGNAKPISYFNSSGNWSSTPTGAKIGPGTTVHLSGIFTTAITFQLGGSGLGSEVTLLFETGAKFSAAHWGNNANVITSANKDWIIVDGGTNGTIEATNNGSSPTYGFQDDETGIDLGICNHCIIRNVIIPGMFFKNTTDSQGVGEGIHVLGSSTKIYGNTVHDANIGIGYNYITAATISSGEIYGNVVYNTNIAFSTGDTGPTAVFNGLLIHDNEMYDSFMWDDFTANHFHHNGIMVFVTNDDSKVTGLQIYNNYIHGDLGARETGHIFLDGEGNGSAGSYSGALIFNNFLIDNSTINEPSNGLIITKANGGSPTVGIYHNVEVFQAPTTSTVSTLTDASNVATLVTTSSLAAGVGSNVTLTGTAHHNGTFALTTVNNATFTYTFAHTTAASDSAGAASAEHTGRCNMNQGAVLSLKDNIAVQCSLFVYLSAGTAPTSDGNDKYLNTGSDVTEGSNSITSNPLLSGTYLLQSGSPAIGAGVSLNSLGVAALELDKAGVARPTGSGKPDMGTTQFVSPGQGCTLSVSPNNLSLATGVSQQFTAQVAPIGLCFQNVIWTTSAGSINSSGLFTAPNVSVDTPVTVTATRRTGRHVSTMAVNITVTPSTIASIAVTPSSANVLVGNFTQYTATATFTNSTTADVTSTALWSTTSGTIASVAAGLATGLGAGSTTVTASVGATSGNASINTTAVNPPVTSKFFGMHINQALNSSSTSWPSAPFGAFRLWDTQSNWNQIELTAGSYNWTALDVRLDPVTNQHSTLDVIYTFGRTPTFYAAPAWIATHSYTAASVVRPATSNGHVYKSGASTCTSAGTQPTFPTGSGATVTDGTCTWTENSTGQILPPIDLASDGTGTNAAFKAFVTALVNRYGNRIQYYEIWNEVNTGSFWTGTNAQLVRMMQDARAIILPVVPTAKFLTPSTTGGLNKTGNDMETFLTVTGATAASDIINFHGYNGNGSCPGPLPENTLTMVNNLTGQMNATNLAKPMWIDEAGWGQPAGCNLYDHDTRSAYVARVHLLAAGLGVARYYWYAYDITNGQGTLWSLSNATTNAGSPASCNGVGTPDGSGFLCKPGVAYGQVYNWMVGASLSGPCASVGTVWTCDLTKPGNYFARAVWDTAQTCSGGVCTTSSYTVPALYAGKTYRDVYGTITNISGSTVPIGAKPVLLETTVQVASTTTFLNQVANNTSACKSNGDRSYCNTGQAWTTKVANTLAQTQTPDPLPAHVSDKSVHTLLYSGWNGLAIAAYQPWFKNASGFNSHIDIGLDESSSTTMAAQMTAMINEGFDIVSPDFYGQNASQAFNLSVVTAMAADLAGRVGAPLKMGIREDGGAISAYCPLDGGGTDQTSCITTHMNSDMDYINSHWAQQNYYWLDNNKPVVLWFLDTNSWSNPTPNWSSIWNSVVTHTNAYTKPFKHVFEYGSFSDPNGTGLNGGEFGWPHPATYVNSSTSTSQQFWWGSPSVVTPNYLDGFYDNGKLNPSKLTIAPVYPGFDNSNASWWVTPGQIIARRCGQTLLNTANEIVHNTDFGTSNQLPYAIFFWNDYEEGTQSETGIDNCYTISAAMATPPNLTWTLTASDATYATTNTIDHFKIWIKDASGNFYPVQDNIPATITSFNIAGLVPVGTWSVYVEMVGKALIQNRMSGAVSYTH